MVASEKLLTRKIAKKNRKGHKEERQRSRKEKGPRNKKGQI
jgi:hypothetical protein